MKAMNKEKTRKKRAQNVNINLNGRTTFYFVYCHVIKLFLVRDSSVKLHPLFSLFGAYVLVVCIVVVEAEPEPFQ